MLLNVFNCMNFLFIRLDRFKFKIQALFDGQLSACQLKINDYMGLF